MFDDKFAVTYHGWKNLKCLLLRPSLWPRSHGAVTRLTSIYFTAGHSSGMGTSMFSVQCAGSCRVSRPSQKLHVGDPFLSSSVTGCSCSSWFFFEKTDLKHLEQKAHLYGFMWWRHRIPPSPYPSSVQPSTSHSRDCMTDRQDLHEIMMKF